MAGQFVVEDVDLLNAIRDHPHEAADALISIQRDMGSITTGDGRYVTADAFAASADLLQRVVKGSLDRAHDAMSDGAPRVAQVLLRYYVPSAFVPALTVLIMNRQL